MGEPSLIMGYLLWGMAPMAKTIGRSRTPGVRLGESRATSGWCATRINVESHSSHPILQVQKLRGPRHLLHHLPRRHLLHHRLPRPVTTKIRKMVASLMKSAFRSKEFEVLCAPRSAVA